MVFRSLQNQVYVLVPMLWVAVGITSSSSVATPVKDFSLPSGAQASAGVIQSQDANQAGVVAEMTECKRAEGVLSVKVRFRNTSNKKMNLQVMNGRIYDKFYVTGGNKKYFVLKDSEGEYLMPATDGFGMLNVRLEPGQAWTWWAKFPAPPPEVTKITLIMPITPPFEDVPITNK